MRIRIFPLAFCTLCLTSGCSFTSAFNDSSMNLFSAAPAVTTTTPAPNEKKKVDVTSEKFKIMHAYQFSVSKRDGVNEDEAIIIAQSDVIFRGYEKDYYLTRPRIIGAGEDDWGVEFSPISKTFQEARIKPRILVKVGKADGKLKVSLIRN